MPPAKIETANFVNTCATSVMTDSTQRPAGEKRRPKNSGIGHTRARGSDVKKGPMIDPLSRRDWLKAMGAAGAGALLPVPTPTLSADAPVLPLTSTSDVFIPPHGRAFQKFSFDFPEPSVEFAGLRFGFLVFTRENAYALDASAMTAEGSADALSLTATRLLWAGGQER